jgi:hypothetical protein
MKTCRIGLSAVLAACLAGRAAGEEPGDARQDADNATRARVLAEMRKRAERTKVLTVSAGQQAQAELVAEHRPRCVCGR